MSRHELETFLYTDPDYPVVIEYDVDDDIGHLNASIVYVWGDLLGFAHVNNQSRRMHEVDILPVLSTDCVVGLMNKCLGHQEWLEELRLEEDRDILAQIDRDEELG